MWAREWQQNQMVYALVEEGSLLDSGGAGLWNKAFNVVMEGQVTVTDGTVTFSAGEVSTMTTIVILLTVSVALVEENTSLMRLGWWERSILCPTPMRSLGVLMVMLCGPDQQAPKCVAGT